MSAFDTNAPTGELNEVTDNFLGHLVGEDKKFVDTEALAKGKYEADKHVVNLERQIAELREDMSEAGKIDELMKLVREQQEHQNKANENNPPNVEGPNDTSSGQMTTEELKALITAHTSELTEQAIAAKNIATVDKALEEKFGEAASRTLHDRAVRMDMSVDEMKVLAASNPKAFYRLMGMDQTTVQPGGLLGDSQRSEGVQIKSGSSRNFAHYQEMRRKDKHTYYSPRMQQQMIKDAETMGDAFYSNS